jgi:hypothetical protein
MTQILLSLGFLLLFTGILAFSVFVLPTILFFKLVGKFNERHGDD